MSFNLQPLEKLLTEEDPLEIARYLDDTLSFLVQLNEYEGFITGIAHHYQMLRALRDAILKSVNERGYGN